jgi:hypothetical protein
MHSTYLLVEQKGGDEIKAKLEEYRKFLLLQHRPDDIFERVQSTRKGYACSDRKHGEGREQSERRLVYRYFLPRSYPGVLALMSKMQNDVRNSEAAVLNELFREAKAKPLTFDAIAGLAVPKTSYALVGQEVEANIMVAAYNKSVTPQISASSGSIKEVKNGIGVWKSTASGLGMQTFVVLSL